MDLQLMLSLEQQALIKVADLLWNKHYMNILVERCRNIVFHFDSLKRLHETTDEITRNLFDEKISKSFLSQIIKRKLLGITKEVGLRKADWYFYHERSWGIKKLPDVFYWTCRGSINRKKTAECLIQDETLDICARYVLASVYCLEREIRHLNERIPGHMMKQLTTYEGGRLIGFWNSFIKDEELEYKQRNITCFADIQHSVEDIGVKGTDIFLKYREAYILSMLSYNSTAAAFFSQKLAKILSKIQMTEFEFYILEMVLGFYVDPPLHHCSKEHYLDTALFVLNRMTMEQKISAFNKNPTTSLSLLLRWPYRNMFPDLEAILCSYLRPEDIIDILCSILNKNNEYFDHQEIFTEFWHRFPIGKRQDVINYALHNDGMWLYLLVAYAKDEEGLFSLLRDATSSQKADLILSTLGIEICQIYSQERKWKLVKQFIEECLSLRPVALIMQLKKNLEESCLLLQEELDKLLEVVDLVSRNVTNGVYERVLND